MNYEWLAVSDILDRCLDIDELEADGWEFEGGAYRRARKPIIVNLFGGPGVGKSTYAAGLFYRLKCLRVDAEFSHEVAKELHFKGLFDGPESLRDQIYIFAKQKARTEAPLPHCEVVVTDCPMLLGANYYPELFPDAFRELLLWSFNQHENLNFFLERACAYNPVGRRQNEDEADLVSVEMKRFLDEKGVPYIVVSGDEKGLEEMLRLTLERLQAK